MIEAIFLLNEAKNAAIACAITSRHICRD